MPMLQDVQLGKIVDFDFIRQSMRSIYDQLFPRFNLLAAMRVGSQLFNDEPSYMIAAGASMLSYQLLLAADEPELAEQCKDGIFTLGWTEEHCGSDLLSVRTQATPLSDDPNNKQYHIKGNKWLINNSFHGDYHIVVAKIDPERNDPRSLSLFLVPRSSTHSWERLPVHVLENMVLTKYEIDGPATLIGKVGHGLSIIQRMAMPSKYQCTYVGVQLMRHAIPATVEHLSTKNIFGTNPINFSNVFRQIYNIVTQAAFYEFLFYRAIALNSGSFLQFHGTLLKSHLLLRINELLASNLLVAGSKGFLKESIIGKAVIDSFVLPVFDGHYTINTFMSAKHMDRYLDSDVQAEPQDRMDTLRRELFNAHEHNEINARPADIRRPEFFDFAAYIEKCNPPIEMNPRAVVEQVRAVLNEITARELTNDPEYKYKTGDMLHWMESVLAAVEFWKLTGEQQYANVIVQQFNGLVRTVNNVIAEGGFSTAFMQPLHHLPLPQVEDARAFFMRLLDVQSLIDRQRAPQPMA
jgi:alkylation response protein AidB-like acyl-CoA dehydrogenase